MSLYVMKEGVHSGTGINTTWGDTGNNINHDCPTNPVIRYNVSPGNEYICAEIRNDNSTPTTMEKITTGTYDNYNENLENTPGYRVKAFRKQNNEGQQFNTVDLTTYDYFILIYADEIKQHHFAKITEVVTDDVLGDALEFTPKLGNEIPKGTKFIVFRGPTITDTSVVAVTAGLLLKGASADTRHNDNLMVSKPLFHFYNDRLDKKNQLDHNTKYKLCYARGTTTTSITLNTISTFTTKQSAKFRVIDKSKFTLNAEIIDNRKLMDTPTADNQTDTNLYYDVGSITPNPNSYNTWALNARRQSDDNTPLDDFTGPTTYLHYEDSPNILNRENNVFESVIFNSLSDKSGIAECKVLDIKNVFSLKNNVQDDLVIREQIEEINLSGWFETDLVLDSITSGSTNLKFKTQGDYDARVLWGQNEEIKIGNYIGFVDSISAPSSNLHTVVCNNKWRLESETFFSVRSSAPFSAGDKIYRRKWSPITKTLMTNLELDTDVTYTGLSALTSHILPLDVDSFTYKINGVTLSSYTDSRYNNAVVLFNDVNYTSRTVRVLFGDRVHSCFRLEPEKTHYRENTVNSFTSLDYAFGKCSVELELFNGAVEEISKDFDNGQPVIEVVGRDDIRKLVSPIINKNTLFTQDIIHSSISPLQNIKAAETSGGVSVTVSSDKDINSTSISISGVIASLSVGDAIFDTNKNFIGIIQSGHDSTTLTLEFGSCVKLASSSALYIQDKKPFTFKKALQASTKNSESVSSLHGASNKGVFFNGGITVDSSGAKSGILAGSSKNTTTGAIGYNFEGITNIKKDRAFQSRLKDDVSGNYLEDDVVNGLSDFVIMSKKTEDKNTVFQLAPRVGLYLGRVDENDTYDADNMTLANTSLTITGSSYPHYLTNRPYLTTGAGIDGVFKRNDPVFVKEVSTGEFTFMGYFIRSVSDLGGTHHYLVLDREITISASSSSSHQIWALTDKDTTDMYFINKPSSLIQKASPIISNTKGLLPFNIHIHDTLSSTVTTDYITRYGPPYYRFLDLEKGNYNVFNEYPIKKLNTTNQKEVGAYYDLSSKTNYYASAYRFKNGYVTSVPTITNSRKDDFTDLHAKQGMFEKRGNFPSRGTNFWDYYLTGNTSPKRRYMSNEYVGGERNWERNLQQFDSKVSRNFLFTTCDLLPESDLRKTSLYYGSRDLSDFSILLQRNGNESEVSSSHTKSLGGGSSISNTDDETQLAQILSGPSINNLKKFTMLRLVEMTLDWHFNSVDAENLPDKEKTIDLQRENTMGNLFKVVDSGGSDVTLASSDYGADSITLNAAPNNLDNSKGYRFYTDNGNWIGTSFAQTYGATIDFDSASGGEGPYANDDNIKGSLTVIYAIDANAPGLYIQGHGSKDTFVDMFNQPLHMIKGAVFQNELFGRRNGMDGYAEDDDDEYHEDFLPNNITGGSATTAHTFSLTDNIASAEAELFDIALPPVFSVPTSLPTRANLVDSVGTQLQIDTGQAVNNGNNVNLVLTGTPVLTANEQYHLFTEAGHYLGRTTSQTYSSSTVVMERLFLFDKLQTATASGKAINPMRNVQYAEVGDESLIRTDGNTHKSEVLKSISRLQERNTYAQTLPVFLDRYDIEDGGQASVSAGMTSSMIVDHAPLLNNFHAESNVSATHPHKLMLGRKSQQGFAHYTGSGKVSKDGETPFQADGAYMLFKPYLLFTTQDGTNMFTGSHTVKAVGDSTNCKKYSFTVNPDGSGGQLKNIWLNFAPNLTGCYLVSFSGKAYGQNASNEDDFESTDSAAGEKSLRGTGESIPQRIHYVISHTITRTATDTRHEIVIDNAASVSSAYKIMRVAENTFYNFSPKTIKTYCLSPTFTKKPYDEECYSEIKSYKYRNTKGPKTETEDRGNGSKTYENTGHGEGVLSMYIIADPSNKGSGSHLVYRNQTDISGLLDNGDNFTAGMTDGENKLKTDINVVSISSFNTHQLTFTKMAEMVGAVSIGEIFSLKILENIKGDYDIATIGCGANVCFETDDLLNDIFEDEGLEFTKQNLTEYPVFVSPEFRGVSLLTAANSLLSRKDRRISYDKKFILRDNNSALNRPKIKISDRDSKYNIRSVKNGKKLFDSFNEVIVYGRNIKSVRKDIRSIKENGKKTLEITDEDIYTQEEADIRASNLLKVHSKIGETIEVEVSGRGLFVLKPGDVIELEGSFLLAETNKRRGEFIIVEKEYSITGLTKLKLGENNKGLEDRFGELLLENKNIRGLRRTKTFKEPSKSSDFFEEIKIKPIRIKVRKRTTSGTAFTLGFSTPLNTAAATMGFTAGTTIVYSDLLEEQL
jgi:hypothetical protein